MTGVLRIAFGFQARVGKSTAVEYLKAKYGGSDLSFAQPLYDILRYAQQTCGFELKKDRRFLQWIGTDWARAQKESVWVDLLLGKVGNGNCYVSDMRFPNEATALRKAGFILVKLSRGEANADVTFGSGSRAHASEVSLNDFSDWDHVIENDGTLDDLHGALDKIVQRHYASVRALDYDTVIYHADCVDGTAGAWPFWREAKRRGANIAFVGRKHGQPAPLDAILDKKVLMVDFCFPRKVMEDIVSKAKRVTVLDHHVSTEKDLKGLSADTLEIVYDVKKSGAQIAWDYVYPDTKRPHFIDVIADRDLWTWKIPGSKEVGKALWSMGYYTWERMEELAQADASFFTRMASIGKVILEQESSEIATAVSRAVTATYTPRNCTKTYRVKVTTCPTHLRSEVGSALAASDCDFAVTWRYDFLSDEWWVSLRASGNSSIDLTEVSDGGHAKASGFTIYGNKGENLRTYFTPVPPTK